MQKSSEYLYNLNRKGCFWTFWTTLWCLEEVYFLGPIEHIIRILLNQGTLSLSMFDWLAWAFKICKFISWLGSIWSDSVISRSKHHQYAIFPGLVVGNLQKGRQAYFIYCTYVTVWKIAACSTISSEKWCHCSTIQGWIFLVFTLKS